MDGGLLPLAGAMNARDIGGYPTAAGEVARGRVYRADHLNELTDDDLGLLADRGIRTVIDLRRDGEIEERPSRLWGTVSRHLHHGIGGEASNYDTMLERFTTGDVADDPVRAMITDYRWMIEERAEVFGQVIAEIADPGNHPVLFHCTAGKDRTGITAAVVLTVCGVDRETVLDDYELTNRFRAARRVAQLRPELEERGIDVDRIAPYFGAPRPALATTLTHLDDRFGGVDAWLTGPAGVSPAALDQLRAALVAAPV